MLSTQTSNNITHEDKSMLTVDELHAQANQYISEANYLIFESLPKVISQIIAKDVWKKRAASYANFGEYALTPSPDGLGITNNEMLWLLKSTMNTTSHHAAQWGDVLGVVDTNVRSYAKEKKIPIKDLSGDLAEQDNAYPELFEDNMITYLPSRSKSVDGQIMKLKKKDPEAYDNVVQGKMKLKEAYPQTPRKKMQPIESAKNKFSSLSKSEREEFLAWIEQERENLS